MNAAFAQAKQVVEAGSPYVATATIFGWLANVLPTVAALFSIMWLLMQMVMNWEKFLEVVKKYFNKGAK